MKHRRSLCVLVLAFSLSAASGFALALVSPFDDTIQLGLGTDEAVLIYVSFDQGCPLDGNRLRDARSCLSKLVPMTISAIAEETMKLADASIVTQDVSGLLVSWREGHLTFEVSEDREPVVVGRLMPIDPGFSEGDGLYCLEDAEVAATFRDGRFASVVMVLHLSSLDQVAASRSLRIDTRTFWSHGRVEVDFADISSSTGANEERFAVLLAPPGDTTRATSLDLLLYGLADCIGAHCRSYADNELDEAAKSIDVMHSLILCIERPCKVSGGTRANCEMTHTAYENGVESLLSTALRTIPASFGNMCYTIFGL